MAKRPIKAPSKSPRSAKISSPTSPAMNWSALERSPQFVELKRAKLAFIVPACAVFIAFYFALPILVGYAPGLMATKVFGALNLAYVFALSQFVMVGVLTYLYVRASADFDAQAAQIAGQGSTKGGR